METNVRVIDLSVSGLMIKICRDQNKKLGFYGGEKFCFSHFLCHSIPPPLGILYSNDDRQNVAQPSLKNKKVEFVAKYFVQNVGVVFYTWYFLTEDYQKLAIFSPSCLQKLDFSSSRLK